MRRYLVLISLVGIIFLSAMQWVGAVEMPGMGNEAALAVDDAKIFITIDNESVDFTSIGPPMLLNTGRTFVPERFMSKYLAFNGHNPEYTAEMAAKNIWLNDENIEMEMTLNKPTALVNGKEVYMECTSDGKPVMHTKPYTYQDRVYVPLRFVCETFGEKVDYNKLGEVHNIAITTNIKHRGTVSPQDNFTGRESLVGYMVIKNNTVYFNAVEIVEWENQERVKAFGLKDYDMPNGYIIINKNEETKSFTLTDKTKYTFTDNNHLFVKKYDGNLQYTTIELAEFLQHLGVYNLNGLPLHAQTIPYFIEVQEGKVISILERFEFTV